MTGKTSTLVLLASSTRRRGHYIAFNKPIALDAAKRFPPTVTCKTAHALAYAAIGHRYARRLGGPRQAGWKTGMALGITKSVRIGERDVSHKALSHAVLRTVTRFCHSADPVINSRHVPQDTNPVLEQVFTAQRTHAQLVMVGDSAQAIYGWRGTRDVMTGFDGRALSLSQSFRFGPRLATEANRWLTIADAPIRLAGTTTIPTELRPVEHPDAVLCRTNVGAMAEVMKHLAAGRRVALTGGGGSLRALANAARALKEGRRTWHPELLLFSSWGELQDYAEHDPAGRDLRPFVDLIDRHGTDAVLAAVDQLAPETHAQVTISTAHRAKGREWPNVRIADDFTPPKDTSKQDANGDPIPGPIDDAEARLAYVAVTRTRDCLDLGGLSWIDRHPDGHPHTPQTNA
ncbi:3'-5' exonuclease [Streptomyces flavidovirens]